jgi:thiol-disulfide isomerase/thioredoxin
MVSSNSSGDIIGQYQDHIATKQERRDSDNDSEVDDDDFLDLLDADDVVTQRYREQRTQQLAQQMATARANAARATVETLDSEEALFALTTSYIPAAQQRSSQNGGNKTAAARDQHAHVIVHFFRPDFTTCQQMDEILSRLARAHFGEVTFARLDVTAAPFLVAKLDLRVLPCVLVLSAATGREVKRLRGFDELGNNPNDLETACRRFEQILFNARVISRVTNGGARPVLRFGESSSSRSIKTSKSRRDDSDDDDWD